MSRRFATLILEYNIPDALTTHSEPEIGLLVLHIYQSSKGKNQIWRGFQSLLLRHVGQNGERKTYYSAPVRAFARRKRLFTSHYQSLARFATHFDASTSTAHRAVLTYMQRGVMLPRWVHAHRDRAAAIARPVRPRATCYACRLRAPHDRGWGESAGYDTRGQNGKFRYPHFTRL